MKLKHRLADITDRRIALLNKISDQRTEIAAISQQWKHPLAIAELGIKAAHFVRAHPGWIIGGVTALVVWRRNGLVHLAKGYWRYFPAIVSYGFKLLPPLFSPSDRHKHKSSSDER